MRRLKTILLTLMAMVPVAVFAQETTTEPPKEIKAPQKEKNKIPFKDRIYIGGNLGLQFGNETYIDISPLVGYKFTEKVTAGAGITYIYYRYKDSYYNYNTSIYGGRIFGRYFFIPSLFAHAEVELLNMELFNTSSYEYYRKNIISPFVGGGYIQRIGSNSGIYLMLLYNLNDSAESPYSNPIVRIGFNVGL
ncbi:MAG: hypothetical protein FNNCIFGK_01261 [Bacteroidia bacterium]|nr:MAG: hypothetical protein UZ10_BCD003001111 [Bacteroidetes bacterium OLB10]MBV6454017.1 hypothetical protein [Bacteroidia bacterium]